MKLPRYTDPWRGGYKTAQESREPGYLERRFREIRERLARPQENKVEQLRDRRARS